MHIPDGFLSNRVALSLDVVSAAGVIYAARRVRVEASARVVPMMGVLGAFVFAAQMLNFPILGGTSGHLVGGALLSILIGPMAGLLTMTTVIIAQALFLQDGGLIALGANIFNIGAITCFSGYAVFQLLSGSGGKGGRPALAAFFAGWTSMMLSAAGCALQLGISGAIPLRVGLPAMSGYHALIGIAEGGLTAGVLSFLGRVRPDLLEARREFRLGVGDWIGALVFVAIPSSILVFAGSSKLPDPLEKMLPAAESDSSAAGAQKLMSFERYHEYIWELLLLSAVIAVAYVVSRMAQSRKGKA
jgi:cobalt/nickel transport system permease protein